MKKILSTLFISMVATTSFAAIGDIFYFGANDAYRCTIIADNEVELEAFLRPEGDIVLPATVSNAGKTYNVVSLARSFTYDNPDLTSVVVPNTVRSIGIMAFGNCPALTRVELPNTVTYIGDNAFIDCTSLREITLPSALEAIEDGVFWGATSLQSIEIPSSVKSIGAIAFMDCASLKSITIPATVQSIGREAFDNVPLETLNINMTSVGNWFHKNPALKSVVLGPSVKTVGNLAFSECPSLSSVTVNGALTSIGEGAFSGCKALSSFPVSDSLTSIGEYAFAASGIREFTIPASVTDFGVNIFGSFEGSCIETLTVNAPVIPEEAFHSTITLERLITGPGVREIKDKAFFQCYALKEITLGETLTTLGEGVFTYCPIETMNVNTIDVEYDFDLSYMGDSKVKTMNFGDKVKSIGPKAFWGSSALETLNLPESLESIGDEAFYFTKSLKSLVIPDGVVSIGYEAFMNAPLEELTLGKSLTTMAEAVFASDELKVVNINCREMADGNWFALCPNLERVNFGPEVRKIGASSFSSRSMLTSITLPEGIEEIGNFAFNSSGLTDISFPNSLVSIGEWSFADTPMKEITVPPTLKHIGDYAFTRIPKLIIHNALPFDNWVDWISVEALVLGDEVTAIPDLQYASSLKEVVMPSNFESIKASQFEHLQSLETVTLPSNLKTIGDRAFAGCQSLRNPEFPNGLQSVGASAYEGCVSITALAMPASLQSIGASAFKYCTGLRTADLQDGVKSIGESAFNGCTRLHWFHVPAGLTEIAKSSFAECALESIHIPDNVTVIAEEAFKNNLNLEEIVLGSGVKSIGKDAFTWSLNVKEIYSLSTLPPAAFEDTFDSYVYEEASLYVPGEAMPAYRGTAPWNLFLNVFDIESTGVEEVETEKSETFPIYDLSGRVVVATGTEQTLRNLPSGIYIFGGRKVAVR